MMKWNLDAKPKDHPVWVHTFKIITWSSALPTVCWSWLLSVVNIILKMHVYSYLDKNNCLLWMLICSCNKKPALVKNPKSTSITSVCIWADILSFNLQRHIMMIINNVTKSMLEEGTIIVDTNLVILYVLSRSTDSWKPKIFLPGYSSLPWLFT